MRGGNGSEANSPKISRSRYAKDSCGVHPILRPPEKGVRSALSKTKITALNHSDFGSRRTKSSDDARRYNAYGCQNGACLFAPDGRAPSCWGTSCRCPDFRTHFAKVFYAPSSFIRNATRVPTRGTPTMCTSEAFFALAGTKKQGSPTFCVPERSRRNLYAEMSCFASRQPSLFFDSAI